MSRFENAKKFFDACETGAGWDGCKEFVADGATFLAQAEALAEVKTVETYCDWMKGLVHDIAPGATYDLHASAYDEETSTAIFFAVFRGKHTGEGGPVLPTGKETNSEYVYVLTMDDSGKVAKMVKVWNDGWALKELGWA